MSYVTGILGLRASNFVPYLALHLRRHGIAPLNLKIVFYRLDLIPICLVKSFGFTYVSTKPSLRMPQVDVTNAA